MKKALKIVIAIVVIGSIGYWANAYFKNISTLQGLIHKEANSVFKIGVNHIKETIVLDALSTPLYYYKNASFKSSKKEKEPKDAGINLRPFNIVGFTVPKVDNTIFSVLKIDDSNDFNIYIEKFAKEKGVKIETSENKRYSFLELKKVGVICAWNTKKIVVSIASKNSLQAVQQVFLDILIDDQVIQEKSNFWIEKLRNSDDHISYFNREGKLAVNFKDGEAVIQGSFNIKEAFSKEISILAMPNTSLSLHYDANFAHKENKAKIVKALNKVSFFEKTNLSVTEFVNRTDGTFYIAMSGNTIQKDSIVTYTYDENFEKIEQLAIDEKKVPKLYLNLGQADKSLVDYLEQQGAISNKIFTALPYYKIFTKEKGLYTTFKTAENQEATNNMVSSYFLDAKVDFKKLEEDMEFPQISPYLNLLSKLRCTARQEVDGIEIKGNISGYNTEVNIISQVAFGINAMEKENLIN